MQQLTLKRLIVGCAAMAALVIGAEARASVSVIGGGLAEACSKAAQSGKVDARYEAPCNDALDKEMLSSRDRAGTLVNRGILKMRRMRWDDATRDFDAALKLYPNLGEAWVNRGAVRIGQHRYADSLPDLDKGLALGVEEPAKVYFNRALANEGLDDTKAAYFDYQKALELNPTWDAPRNELVRFHVQTKP